MPSVRLVQSGHCRRAADRRENFTRSGPTGVARSVRSPIAMTPLLDPFPPADPASTLGALLGPVAGLGLVAILVALGVIVVGLAIEGRETARRRRWAPMARWLSVHSTKDAHAAHA
jgi:hypothetical protein